MTCVVSDIQLKVQTCLIFYKPLQIYCPTKKPMSLSTIVFLHPTSLSLCNLAKTAENMYVLLRWKASHFIVYTLTKEKTTWDQVFWLCHQDPRGQGPPCLQQGTADGTKWPATVQGTNVSMNSNSCRGILNAQTKSMWSFSYGWGLWRKSTVWLAKRLPLYLQQSWHTWCSNFCPKTQKMKL